MSYKVLCMDNLLDKSVLNSHRAESYRKSMQCEHHSTYLILVSVTLVVTSENIYVFA